MNAEFILMYMTIECVNGERKKKTDILLYWLKWRNFLIIIWFSCTYLWYLIIVIENMKDMTLLTIEPLISTGQFSKFICNYCFQLLQDELHLISHRHADSSPADFSPTSLYRHKQFDYMTYVWNNCRGDSELLVMCKVMQYTEVLMWITSFNIYSIIQCPWVNYCAHAMVMVGMVIH